LVSCLGIIFGLWPFAFGAATGSSAGGGAFGMDFFLGIIVAADNKLL
jgi:hypothetical protein